jgi:hypothetical protein
MRTSYWKFCFPGPTGEEICTELYADLSPEIEGQIRDEVAALAGVEALASQVTDAALRIRLVEALDDAAVRLNTRLSGGTVLRRSDPGTFEDDPDGFVGVPFVVGMTEREGYDMLRAAGYQVKTVWEWTSPTEEYTITDQAPKGGAANLPPTLVYIWVRTLPPDPPRTGDPTPAFLPE